MSNTDTDTGKVDDVERYYSEETTSDTSSIIPSSSGGSGIRKGMIINRLKAEVALLRENLEAAKSEDIVLLSTKLRGAKEDISRLKSRNSEFKDRIQILEGSLHNALQTNQQLRQQAISLQQREIYTMKEQTIAEESEHLSDTNSENGTNSIASAEERSTVIIRRNPALRRALALKDKTELEGRCNHLMKLNAALQGRIDEMQLLLDSLRPGNGEEVTKSSKTTGVSKRAVAESSSSASSKDKSTSFKLQEKLNSLTEIPSLPRDAMEKFGAAVDSLVGAENREELSKEIAAILSYAREYDHKTIGELAREVKRLSMYAPEERDSESELEDSPHEGPLKTSDDELVSAENSYIANSGGKAAVDANKSIKNGRHLHVLHLICAFVCGVIAVFLLQYDLLYIEESAETSRTQSFST